MRPTDRAVARALAAVAVAAGLPLPAAAQHRHHGSGAATGGAHRLHIHAGVSAELGSVEFVGSERDYQGLAVMAGARLGSAELHAHVPFYRIDLAGDWSEGPGDPHLEARWVALALAGGALEAGPSFAVMPPIGDDEHGLGMGHWMLMAGGFARVTSGRLGASASLGYAGALGEGGHSHHGGGVRPPVAPMNAHEIDASLEGRVALVRGFGLAATLSGAAPLGDGELLALAGAGATFRLGPVELGLGLAHGLFEHPAALRASTQVMASF